MTASRAELNDMIAMLQDAIAEGSPLTERLQAEVAKMRAELGDAPDVAPDRTEDALGGYREGGSAAANQFASDKQIAFLRRLIRTKDWESAVRLGAKITIPADEKLDSISKKGATALIDKLLGCPDKPVAAGAPDAASDKQVAVIVRESARRVGFEPMDEALARQLSKRAASALLDQLFAARFKPREPEWTPESGIYRNPETGQIYKVYTNQARTRMLAKLLVINETDSFDMQHGFTQIAGEPRWDYQGMATRFVKPGWLMTLEQAKQFGTIYGVCCSCGRLLTDEGSIEAGIGPVCAKKGRWA